MITTMQIKRLFFGMIEKKERIEKEGKRGKGKSFIQNGTSDYYCNEQETR